MAMGGVGQPLMNLGVWERKVVLGSGAFGKVVLWQNGHTKEEIAIKTLTKECSGDIMKRWQNEMTMVKNLNHENIVSYVAIPEVLQKEYPPQISLGMEYCCIGDLRKFMARPEYCCGVDEIHIKDMLSDIGSALYYIHDKHNMHRDLKPENIVLKPRNGFPSRFQFKITDLGYAKDLDLGVSCGISFVGTWHYLAPEFITNNTSTLRYYSPVDFWSFGMVAFECITGYRPFFSDLEPINILTLVQRKMDNHIHGWSPRDGGQPKFVDHIPLPHSLNPHLTQDLVPWLRLMLRVDGKRRGGQNGEWHRMLSEILPKKYIEVLNTANAKTMTFPVTESTNVNVIKKQIYQETKIPMTEQLLLLQNYEVPRENVGLLSEIRKTNVPERNTLYLYSSHSAPRNSQIYSIPKEIEQRRNNSTHEYSDHEQKRASKIALHFILSNTRLAFIFIEGLCALNENVYKLRSSLKERLRNFRQIHYRVEGRIQSFKESLECDTREFEEQERGVGGLVNHQYKNQSNDMRASSEEWERQIGANSNFIKESEDILSDESILPVYGNLKMEIDVYLEEMKNLRQSSVERYTSNKREVQKRELMLREPLCDKLREHESALKTYRRNSLHDFIKEFVDRATKFLERLFSDKFFLIIRKLVNHRKQLWEKLMEMDRKKHELSLITQNLREKQYDRQHSIWLMLRTLRELNNLSNEYEMRSTPDLGIEITKLTETIESIRQDEVFMNVMDFVPESASPDPTPMAPSSADSGTGSRLEISSNWGSSAVNGANQAENEPTQQEKPLSPSTTP